MNGKRSREAAMEFHDYLARKGLMSKPTALARKAALSKVLGVLSEEEAQDVTNLDLEDVMTRFTHLEGASYTPESLTTYKSRVKSALEDFNSYLGNPLGFRPSLNMRKAKGTKFVLKPTPLGAAQGTQEAAPAGGGASAATPTAAAPAFDAASILPIPLRADLVVRIQGIPFDLTEPEAKKIANVVLAMAMAPT
jgi:hypothetical protein